MIYESHKEEKNRLQYLHWQETSDKVGKKIIDRKVSLVQVEITKLLAFLFISAGKQTSAGVNIFLFLVCLWKQSF